MKTEIEQLIDRLASKKLTFGCWVEVRPSFGNPIKREWVKLSWWHSDNWCSNDQLIDSELWEIVKVLGHDILIGDILELMEKKKWGVSVRDLINIPNSATIIDLWAQCRTPSDIENRKTELTKSLQEIIASTEWEEAECHEPHCKNGHYPLGMTEDGEVDWGACPKCKPLEGKALFPKSPAVERLVGNLLSLDL